VSADPRAAGDTFVMDLMGGSGLFAASLQAPMMGVGERTGGWIYDTQVAEMRKRERESEEGRKEGEEAVTPSQALGGDLRHCFPSFPVKMSTLSTFYA